MKNDIIYKAKNKQFFFEAEPFGFKEISVPLSVQMPCQHTKACASKGITTPIGANLETPVLRNDEKNNIKNTVSTRLNIFINFTKNIILKQSLQRGSEFFKIAPIVMESPQRIALQRVPRGLAMESGTQSNCEPIRSASNEKYRTRQLWRLAVILVFAVMWAQLTWAQCYPDRHSTNANDGWISCTETPNPNNVLGNSHWILYNLGQTRNLYSTTFWNSNHPNHLAWGVKRMRFDYSMDSLNWTYLTTYEFDQASGKPLYEGEVGPNFNGVPARYVLLTPIENYGAVCVGFSEIRINTEPSPANTLSLNLNPCLNEGIIYNINGGVDLGGIYSGAGVVNNYDDKFDFDPETAGPGSHTITYQYTQANGNLVSKTASVVVKNCGTADCPPCAPCGNEPQSTFNADPVPNGLFYKDPTINSTGTINTGFDVDYFAEQSVSLNNNFSVKPGANFKADIRDCDPEPNLFVNGGFENSSEPWRMELHETANAQLFLDTNQAFEGNTCGRVEVSNVSSMEWHIQFQQFGMSVDNGKSYTVSFAAKTDQPKSIWTGLSRHNSPWNGYGGSTINLTTQWQVFTFTVTPNETNIGQTRFFAVLNYQGGAPANYWFDDLKMTLNE